MNSAAPTSSLQIFCILIIIFGLTDAIFPSKRFTDRRYASAFGSLADKYANVRMSRKEIINELQGLSRKAVELQQKWKLRSRTKNYSPQEFINNENKKQPAPFVIPVNRPAMPESAAHKLALLQLRDCVFVRSGCVTPSKMNTSQRSNYIDQLEAILGGKGFYSSSSPPIMM